MPDKIEKLQGLWLRAQLENCAILHIDDDDAAAFLFRFALDQAGIGASVYRLTDGEQGLLFLRKKPPYEKARTPEVVVSDLNLPKITGWELLAVRQKDAALMAIPFIVLSTASASRNAPKALECGAQHYIEKTGSFQDLVQKVELYCKAFLA